MASVIAKDGVELTPSLPSSGTRHRKHGRAALIVAAILLAWSAFAWTVLRPPEIVSDWNSWRQADTQTIALNFTKPGSSIFLPTIRWGGDGPGYVEAEFQLYTKIVSVLMLVFGGAEWVGQLVSLLAIVGTACVIFVHLSRRYQPVAVAVGVMAFLASRPAQHLATVVMPDALALLAYAAAWACFWQYARLGRGRDLVMFGIIGTIAMLTKPTTAHIGISSVLFLALSYPARLRDYRVWATWVAMVAVVGLYLWHANGLYTDYGNTFGLLAGEDRKTPLLRHLLMPEVLLRAIRNAEGWGLGHVAALALIVQTLRRRVDAEHVALAVGNAVIVVVALRYMSQDAGNYYFAPAAVLAASSVASLVDDLLEARKTWRYAALGAIGLLLMVQGYRNLNLRYVHGHFVDPEVANVVKTGKQLALLTNPDDLVIVRSVNEAYDVFWQSGRNYHEPRIFYITGTRGWTMGREQADLDLLADATRRGARFFVDPLSEGHPQVDAWLRNAADLVWSEPDGGRIWRLRPAPRPAP
jgi:hypothetical protein